MTTRRNFLKTTLLTGAALSSASALVAGCDSDPATGTDAGPTGGSDSGPTGGCTPSASIGSNHGHALTVPAADVAAGAEQTYDITGTSTHSHSLTLTAAHFTGLSTSGTITITASTGGGHTHDVTVTCS